MELEIVNKLYLELSHISTARTYRDLKHERLVEGIEAEYRVPEGWFLPFYGVTSSGELVAEMLPIIEWKRKIQEAAMRIAR